MTLSLRARLLILTVALVALGLAIAGLATFRFERSFLLRRVDEQAIAARDPAARSLGVERYQGPAGSPRDFFPLPGTYAAILDERGEVVSERLFALAPARRDFARPELPADLPGSVGSRLHGERLFGVRGYRVLATSLFPEGGTFVVALPLTETNAALGRLIRVEAAVGASVLLLVAGLALWLVRVGLRPLEGMGVTAGAIAAGDLTRRVEPADERTEVGRLGLSLNAMLAQIEAAFEERRASEDRLRRFVADASHELRTPLTSIRGYAELFRRGARSRPEDLATSMARIEAEASRMGVLVDDLLLLARLDQGRPLEREPVNVAHLAAEAVEDARAADPGRPLDLDAPTPAVVQGDAGRLRQVLDNLLHNVRTHTPPGAPARISVAPAEDGSVVLSVADAGPGLDADLEAHAFERFVRGDPARGRGGAGLGLSIVAAIVQAHGGSVSVTSSDDGARFVVTLPRVAPATAEL